MYLDPGFASLVVQATFALLATVVAAFGRSRAWVVAMWSRALAGISRGLRRRKP